MLGMQGTHQHGMYSVTIAQDGKIVVKPGDWLSKYSAAMYRGDTSRVNEFGRMQAGRVVPITNVNQIVAGETIYHVPTHSAGGFGVAVPPSQAPSQFQQHEEVMRAAMLPLGHTAQDKELWEEFRKAVEDTTSDWGKLFFMVSRSDDAVKLATFWSQLRHYGVSTGHMKFVVKKVAGIPQSALAMKTVESLSQATGTAGKSLKIAKGVGDKVQYVTMLINTAVAFDRGDYHIATVEIYKFAMGKAVPWADLIDGIEGFVSGVWPGSAKSSVWKYLRTANPIGLGAVAVDTFGVLITGLVEGKVDDLRLDRLVQRIKKSPAQLFYEIGDDLADALDSMSRMSDEDFNEMVSLESVTGWLRYLVTGKLPGE